jgi:hypothetical protein
MDEMLLVENRGRRRSKGAPRFDWLSAVASCKQRKERLRAVAEEAHSDMGS